MSDRQDIDKLIETTEVLRGGLEILKEIVDADKEEILAEMRAGFAELNQTLQILLDENKAAFKRIQVLEDQDGDRSR